ncbi:MAG: redoxin domain-containing protein [Isosphaeraceae bacterium]
MAVRNWFGISMAALGLFWACSVRAGEELPLDRLVGQKVGDFTLNDVTNGEALKLYDLAKRKTKAVVIFFSATACPNSNGYLPRLIELAETYKDKGVVVLAINSNASESAVDVAAHAKEFGLTFPVLKDVRNVIADQYLVESTCETLLIDQRGRLRYRGALDDQFGVGLRRAKVGESYLVDALDAVLDGKEVETKSSKVAGCMIERAEIAVKTAPPRIRPAAPEIVEALKELETPVEVGPVTYAADVAPIIQNRCQSCHRPKQTAPFALMGYDDARRWAATIQLVVEDRRMPPWHADPRFGTFENDRRLTPRERATLLAWVDQGAPLGDPAALPKAKVWPDEWVVGEPDVVLTMPEPYTVPAQGEVAYQYFVVPTGFTEDRWVQSVEAKPGDRSVVHHIIVYLDDKQGNKRQRGHLGGYTPGEMPSVFPPGVAKLVPAGSNLVLQVHYTPMGKIKVDQSRVGFIFAKTPPTRQAVTESIHNPRFVIPPHDANYEVRARYTFAADAKMISLMPHMHLRGKDFLYTATYPDGSSEILLSVPAYDFAWQSYYRLAEPKAMPKGTIIDCVAHFDNSADNPLNPDPEQEVRWGDQTREEMMLGYIDIISDIPTDPEPNASAAAVPEVSLTDLLNDFLELGRAVQRQRAKAALEP